MEFGMEVEFINIPRDQMIVADESIFEQYNMPWKRVLIKNNLNSVNCCDKTDLVDIHRNFQQLVGLPVTGILDRKTVKKMQAPRCGNKDILRDKDTASRTESSDLQLKPAEFKTLGKINWWNLYVLQWQWLIHYIINPRYL